MSRPAKMKDPRVALVAEVMLKARTERLQRMLTVRDMRKREGRVLLEEEAQMVLDALDRADAELFDAAIARAKAAAAEGQ